MHIRTFLSLICFLIIAPAPFIFAEDAPPESPSDVPARTIFLTLRDGENLIWSGEISLADSDMATTSITASDGTVAEALSASALVALMTADAASDAFTISNLQYFSSFESFYTKCITTTEEKCDNWQYVVGETYPSLGMDQYVLHDDDVLFVYFGSPRRTILSTSTIATGETFTATAERYVPANDTYTPVSSVTIGITQINPDDPYSPLTIATSTSDSVGSATFILSAPGSYEVGIAEDFYYPSTSLTVTDAEETPEKDTDKESWTLEPEGSGVSGGGGSSTHSQSVNVSAAMSFLAQHQRENGSFETPLLTDWAALAFAATSESESGEERLRDYLSNTSGAFSSATDYERHAMALMALDIDPRSGTSINYIAKILSYFDGEQFGDAALVNDDVFALIPLSRAGYAARDPEIANTVVFLLDRQRNDGSWDRSVDLTAAAIQALTPFESLQGVSDAVHNAETFLHSEQKIDGGFSNGFSTSWALQTISTRGDMTVWQPAGKNPSDYLASLQASDGGIEPASSDTRTRVWATEYAIPAILGKGWHSILRSFDKPAQTQSAVSDSVSTVSTSSVTTQDIEETPTLRMPVENIPAVAIPTVATDPEAAVYTPEAPTLTLEHATSTATSAPMRSQFAAASVVSESPKGMYSRMLSWFARIGAALRSLFYYFY